MRGKEQRKGEGMSEELVSRCRDCPHADDKSKTCRILIAPVWQWREGRYCWGRALAERGAQK